MLCPINCEKLPYYHVRMGPKKAPAGKKKEGNPENGGELTAEEKAKLFMLTCQSLQVQLCKFSEVLQPDIHSPSIIQTIHL